LKDIAERNAKTEAQNQEIRKKNSEFLQRENIKLQAHLLASQDRVYELQTELLRVREIINSA
jgi:capsule polysaccharide export protein KpsE/RkpR